MRCTVRTDEKITCTHSTVEPLVLGDQAPALSAHDGATSAAPVTSQACWLLPLLHVLLYWVDAVALVAQLHVSGTAGGSGGAAGGGGGRCVVAGGGGDGDGGGMISTTGGSAKGGGEGGGGEGG
eukprot:2296008-Prymnesium_polylepis.1